MFDVIEGHSANVVYVADGIIEIGADNTEHRIDMLLLPEIDGEVGRGAGTKRAAFDLSNREFRRRSGVWRFIYRAIDERRYSPVVTEDRGDKPRYRCRRSEHAVFELDQHGHRLAQYRILPVSD